MIVEISDESEWDDAFVGREPMLPGIDYGLRGLTVISVRLYQVGSPRDEVEAWKWCLNS